MIDVGDMVLRLPLLAYLCYKLALALLFSVIGMTYMLGGDPWR